MIPPRPILCDSCAYDITSFADAARADPTIPCPECGNRAFLSLPGYRRGTPWQLELSNESFWRTYLLAHTRPRRLWREVRPIPSKGIIWLINIACALLANVLISAIWLCATFGLAAIPYAFHNLFFLLPALPFLTVTITLVARLLARVVGWRLPKKTVWTVMDHSTIYWTITIAFSTNLLFAMSPLYSAFPSLESLLDVLFLTAFVLPPLVMFAATLFGLRALRIRKPSAQHDPRAALPRAVASDSRA